MLIEESEIAARVAPGLVKALSAGSVMELEESGAEVVAGLFREHGRPGFLVRPEHGGDGGSLFDLAHLLRWVGARCPSLAILMTMHQHSVGAFARGSIPIAGGAPFLKRVAGERALVASAFAEGRPGAEILDSTVECTRLDGGAGFRITGVKKPCSMTHQADFAVVGVALGFGDGTKSRGIALVDKTLDGIRTENFWPGDLLGATDSHSLSFDGVIVPDACVLGPREAGKGGARERMAVAYAEIALSSLFQTMASASYLGIASRLCEMALIRKGGTPGRRVAILSALESAAMSVYHLARMIDQGDFSGFLLARAMLVAHNAAAQAERAAAESAKILGGFGYLGSREAQYLLLASKCIYFHPPSEAVREQIVDSCFTDLV